MLEADFVELIYDSSSHATSFFVLAETLKRIEHPVLILMKEVYHTIEDGEVCNIIGGVTNCKWEESVMSFGNRDCYIF